MDVVRRKTEIQMRWLIRKDMPEVIRIAAECFDNPWEAEDFERELRGRNCIGMVAEVGPVVIGYIIYKLEKAQLRITNLAVDPRWRRQGVGSQMIQRMVDKLSVHRRRSEIALDCAETNLGAQLFFKDRGFRAIAVLRAPHGQPEDATYSFLYKLDAAENENHPYFLKNRITGLV